MAQPAPATFRLTKHQTAEAIAALEERKYGRRLNSEELAQKANVDLDAVNRVERQLPIENRATVERIAHALGINADLLEKVAGLAEISQAEWAAFPGCLAASPPGQPVPAQCERIGFRQIWK